MTEWQTKLTTSPTTLHVYLMGIGGAGLSAIATVLLEMGVRVSGSDRQHSQRTETLAAMGAQIFVPQVAENFDHMSGGAGNLPDVVLMSSAIADDNAERQAAERLNIPVVKRSDFLPTLLHNRTVIAVAGTHGKSTTTSMIIQTLREAGIEAGYIVGTSLPTYGNANAGSSPYFVIEADEYDYMFLGTNPTIAVVTNVEWDHPDCFPKPADFHNAFEQFVDLVPASGLVISCMDDTGAEQLRTRGNTSQTVWMTYGTDKSANLVAINPTAIAGQGYEAALQVSGEDGNQGILRLHVPGLHNLRNAMAAYLVAVHCGVLAEDACTSLSNFRGTARRFEHKGTRDGVTVIDDYAHHPSEIETTLAGASKQYPNQRIWAVFQPHTFSRTKNMVTEMASSFDSADQVLVLDIYAAREIDDGSIHASDIVAASHHTAIHHVPSFESAVEVLCSETTEGDVIITLGAGDGYLVGELFLSAKESIAG
ncbi:MAG: UDP-N-acetylmuramate--L-alanine ligase [Chloroflexota bacterium]